MHPHRKAPALIACVVAVPLAVGLQRTDGEHKPAPVRDGALIHVSKGREDLHAAAMALKMANLMAADRDVMVYCDLRGIDAVLRDVPDLAFPAIDSSRADQVAAQQIGAGLGMPIVSQGVEPDRRRPHAGRAHGRQGDSLHLHERRRFDD
jgi:hypothetical protein